MRFRARRSSGAEPRRVAVAPATERVPAASLRAAAERALEDAFPRFDGRDVHFRLVSELPEALEVPLGDGAARVEARLPAHADAGSNVDVLLRVSVDGVPYRTLVARWRVELYETCLVPRHAIAAGAPLDRDLFERARVRRTRGLHARPVDASALVGARAMRALEPGVEVLESDVEHPPLIEAGSLVLLRVRSGSLEVTTRASALEGGRLGDSIRVRTIDRDKELTAVVRGPGLVVVQLSKER